MSLDSARESTGSSEEERHEEEQERAALEFCRLIGKLKTTPRTGWVRRQVPSYESVADHSWRVAAMAALLFDSNDIDGMRNDHPPRSSSSSSDSSVVMAIVHDLAECIVGDICPEDQITNKHEREANAMKQIVHLLRKANGAHQTLEAAFEDYEARRSSESQLVKDLDGLDMILQAAEYEERYGLDNLDDFFQPRKCYYEKVQRLIDRIKDDRSKRKASQTKDPTQGDVLSLNDQAFIEEHARASPLSGDDISKVVLALRQWEQT